MSKGIEINVLFGDGSKRKATITPGALSLVRRFAGAMPSLFDGTGFNPLNADVSNIIAITRSDHEILHRSSGGQRKADFRLGQMEMKESIVNMLRNAGDVRSLELRAGLSLAAALVESMEVPYADTRE